MRLIKVKLSGIRRFETTDALHVADRLVAIVGPNESGKTSLLRALDQINREEPLPEAIRTRQSSTEPRLEALFALSPDDQDALVEVRGGADIQRAWVIRTTASNATWRLEPEPTRDLQPRLAALEATLAIADDPDLSEDNSNPEHAYNGEVWEAAIAALESENDSLDDEQRLSIARLANAVAGLTIPGPEDEAAEEGPSGRAARLERRRLAVDALHALGVTETEEAPRRAARRVLRTLLPTIVEFTDEDRDLRPDYNLDEALQGETAPPALQNLADLARLDLRALHAAIGQGDNGTVRLLRENANIRLEKLFSSSYGQSDACVQFDNDGAVLQLLVRAEGGFDFVPLDQHSAGFQWFVAMTAFLAQQGIECPLLLIDEIERHLHYAAQADLIDVLVRQQIAEQIIYTTHSVGALPPDLGTGVRAVVPIPGHQRSRIDNSFWTSGPGFTPLLFGLGAPTLAFAIPRHVLIAEGASEAVLLPTLLRTALGMEELPYRVAPGIANTPPSELHRLDEEGGRVAYLVDGDVGGETHCTNLLKAGVEPARVLSLLAITGEPASLEDLVNADVYAAAVRAELEPFLGTDVPDVPSLPQFGRAKIVEQWCVQRSADPPSKVRVAQRVASVATEHLFDSDRAPIRVFSDEALPWLKQLHRVALLAMHIEPPADSA